MTETENVVAGVREAALQIARADSSASWSQAVAAVVGQAARALCAKSLGRRVRPSAPVARLVALLSDGPLHDAARMLGMSFEALYGYSVDEAEPGDLLEGSARRDRGVYFTPHELVDWLVAATLNPILARAASLEQLLAIRVVDPAAGAGVFLISALGALSSRARELAPDQDPTEVRRLIAESCLFGVDRDPGAVDVTRSLLALTVQDAGLEQKALAKTIRCGDSLLGFAATRPQDGLLFPDQELPVRGGRPIGFHWGSAFPQATAAQGGFDAVLSNPPWEKIKSCQREFFAYTDSRVHDLQGRALRDHLGTAPRRVEEEWVRHQQEVRNYADQLARSQFFSAVRESGGGRSGGGGDPDLYRFFMELAVGLVHKAGRIGLVVPSAFYQAHSAAGIRRLYLNGGTFEALLGFENRRRIFPIHGMFRFSVFVWQRGMANGIGDLRVGLTELGELRGHRGIALDRVSLEAVGDTALGIPEIRSATDRDLLCKLKARHAPLGSEIPGAWRASFVRELDMTNDSDVFVGAEAQSPGLLPLFEGRLVHQHDYAAKRYLGGSGRRARWEPLSIESKRIEPHYYVSRTDAEERGVPFGMVRAGFCDVTGHANERTVLSALIPTDCVCGNKVPTLRFDREDPRLHLLWVAIANSFVIDWLIRRRITTTLNFFHWHNTPFPRLEPSAPEAAALILLASRLANLDGRLTAWVRSTSPGTRPARTLQERAIVRAAIDVQVAKLFDLRIEELAHILADFRSLDRGQPPIRDLGQVEPHSTVTRDAVLFAYSQVLEVAPLRDIGVLPGCGEPGASILVQGLQERVERAHSVGAVAYVPGELALRSTSVRV